MESIDLNLKEMPSETKNHCAECKDCYHYYKVSLKLKEESRRIEFVELWNEFERRKEFKPFRPFAWKLGGALGIAAILVVISIASFNRKDNFFTSDFLTNNAVSNHIKENATVNTDYDYEETDLNYHYNISLEI
jgi:hypothetical protein